MSDLDLFHNPDPVCPHCGASYRDAWELRLEDGGVAEVECGSCENEYTVTCSITVTYDTTK